MKTKKASKPNARSRIIFFAIALTYNLLLGIYLKNFLVLSPMFTTFYIKYAKEKEKNIINLAEEIDK